MNGWFQGQRKIIQYSHFCVTICCHYQIYQNTKIGNQNTGPVT